ncbi:MAG: hypothetical protein IKD53_05705 [Clostridia bacterium]|nr:hypothetical protein [Clostridia bacterium]
MERDARGVQAVVFNKHGVGHMARVERFPQPGETVRALEWRFGEDGGKGTNAAVALALNGVRTALVTKVGQDDGGQLGLRWLEAAGVDCSRYLMSPDIATDVGLVITRADGENVVIGSPAHPCYMDKAELREALDAFPGAGYFIAGFEFDQALALEGCRLARERGMTVMLNPSPPGRRAAGAPGRRGLSLRQPRRSAAAGRHPERAARCGRRAGARQVRLRLCRHDAGRRWLRHLRRRRDAMFPALRGGLRGLSRCRGRLHGRLCRSDHRRAGAGRGGGLGQPLWGGGRQPPWGDPFLSRHRRGQGYLGRPAQATDHWRDMTDVL